MLVDVGQQLDRRELRVDLVEAQDASLHPVEHLVAHIGCLHGSGQVHQLHAEGFGQEHACGAAKQPEEGTTLHAGIRRWGGWRHKPQPCGIRQGDGGGLVEGVQRSAGLNLPPLGVRLLPPCLALGKQLTKDGAQGAPRL